MGTTVAKLVRVASLPAAEQPRSDGLCSTTAEWMIPAAAERERSIEHLRGSGKILATFFADRRRSIGRERDLYEGDIVSPIDEKWEAAAPTSSFANIPGVYAVT